MFLLLCVCLCAVYVKLCGNLSVVIVVSVVVVVMLLTVLLLSS